MVNDFLDNLGARQHRKMTERNASKEEITNTCEDTYGKKTATKKPSTTQKAKAKSSKTPSTRQKSGGSGKQASTVKSTTKSSGKSTTKPRTRKKPEPKLKRKKLSQEEMFYLKVFPSA